MPHTHATWFVLVFVSLKFAVHSSAASANQIQIALYGSKDAKHPFSVHTYCRLAPVLGVVCVLLKTVSVSRVWLPTVVPCWVSVLWLFHSFRTLSRHATSRDATHGAGPVREPLLGFQELLPPVGRVGHCDRPPRGPSPSSCTCTCTSTSTSTSTSIRSPSPSASPSRGL
jgi:hypothetical protein